jgi:hypothetical protein
MPPELLRGIAMKVALAIAGVLFVLAGISDAHAMACKGTVATRTGPNGKVLKVCLDGKYSTCLRDGQRLGHSYMAAKLYCDGQPNLK